MRKALLFLLAGACWAQTMVDYPSQIKRKPISAAATLPSSCTVTGNLFVLTTTNQFYVCNAGVYVIATAAAVTPAGATTQIQFNNAGAFGASANLFFTSGNLNNTGSATNGFRAPVFNALNNSTVNPSSDAFTTSDQSVHITGAGNIFGQSLALTNGWTGGSGAYGMTGGGALTVSSCAGCGAGTVGGATTQIQYNNSGVFAGSANFSWNNSAAVMNVGEVTPTSGIRSPVFSALNNSTHNPSSDAFTTSDQSAHITGAGNILGQSLAVTNGITAGAGAYGLNQFGAFTGTAVTIGTNNGSVATAGFGAVISKSDAAYSIDAYDTGGKCHIGTTVPGISCTSDARLKIPGESIADGLTPVMGLRPLAFIWKANGVHSTGFLAQEVATVLPALVGEGDSPEKYLTLSEIGMIPYLVRSIQQLQAEIQDLKRGQSNSPLRTNARAQR